MLLTSPARGWPVLLRGKRQHGQALIYGMFVMIASLTGLFFLFNTGQLASEKTKLVNTADAVAYSAGILHARALNFDAYNNRALVANEVLVAQIVSLSSWSQYAAQHIEQVPLMFPECADPRLAAADALFNFDPIYAGMCFLLTQPASPGVIASTKLIEKVPEVAREVMTLVEGNKKAIQLAEAFLHADGNFQAMRMEVMQQVADRNYANDGSITIHTLAAHHDEEDVLDQFVTKYKGEDRTRLANVVSQAASTDKFVKDRQWDSEATVPPPWEWKCLLHRRKNSVKRRGGTELVGLDEWKSEDTESFWQVRNAGGFFNTRCNSKEHPIAVGEQRAFPDGSEQDASNAKLGDSPTTNPRAHASASSAEWTNYSGIPAFYDLAKEAQDSNDPRLTFSVRLSRAASAIRTSDGASNIHGSPHLNHFATNLASGVMSAMATSEVYFERPWFNTGDYSYSTGEASYVVTQNQAKSNPFLKSRELGSLFNPYWQVRLVANKADDVKAEQALLGAELAP
jgi:hypothetical protein